MEFSVSMAPSIPLNVTLALPPYLYILNRPVNGVWRSRRDKSMACSNKQKKIPLSRLPFSQVSVSFYVALSLFRGDDSMQWKTFLN